MGVGEKMGGGGGENIGRGGLRECVCGEEIVMGREGVDMIAFVEYVRGGCGGVNARASRL